MSKSIKGNARTVAAPIAVEPRDEFKTMAAQIEDKAQSLSQLIYEAAMLARRVSATKEENALLLAVIPKQRRNEYRRIVAAPAEHFGRNAPTNLTKLAKYLKARAEGATAADAKKVAEQKISAEELREKLGKPAPKKAPKKAPKNEAGHGGLHALHDAIESLRKDYGDDKDVLDLLASMSDLYDDLVAVTAKADA